MKFQDLPKDAQHHALSTLRELMVVGGEKESGADIAAKVKAAFVSMYSETTAPADARTPVVEIIALTGQPFCPTVDCGECEFTACTSSLQRAGVMTVAEAQHKYDVALENLKLAEADIQRAVNTHG